MAAAKVEKLISKTPDLWLRRKFAILLKHKSDKKSSQKYVYYDMFLHIVFAFITAFIFHMEIHSAPRISFLHKHISRNLFFHLGKTKISFFIKPENLGWG